jgi:hypothetical protein
MGDVFMKIFQMEDIIKSGERIITNLYGGVPSESLNVLRYKQFASKVATGKEVIQIHTLPPTNEAAVYHSLRVYYQAQIWIGERFYYIFHLKNLHKYISSSFSV